MTSSSTGQNTGGSQAENNGPTVRAMRLKVLYTFDEEGKQTCLARWHQFVHSQFYHLNPQTPIGVVDLRTCVNAIASASPEIVASLGKDYSVYSYDYTEADTPLQGLGMLSWIMGSGAGAQAGSSNGGGRQPQGGRLITGKVCTNQMGLFNDVTETLEVRMKLVPVPTIKQSDYINSMNVYNTLSKIIPGDFDASAWSAYFQANPNLLAAAATVSQGAQVDQNLGGQCPNPEYRPQRPIHPPPQAQTQHQAPPPPPPPQQQPQMIVEEQGPPKKKPRVYQKRAPKNASTTTGPSRKKPVPAPISAASTPAPPTPSDAGLPYSHIPPSEYASESPVLPRASVVRRPSVVYDYSPPADAPTGECLTSTSQIGSPFIGSSPPTSDSPPIEEYQQAYSPEPTSPILPSNEKINTDIHQELDALFSQNEDNTQEDQQLPPILPEDSPTVEPFPVTAPSHLAQADDIFVNAAPSPVTEITIPPLVAQKAKPKRKYVKKSKNTTSDAVGIDEGDDESLVNKSKKQPQKVFKGEPQSETGIVAEVEEEKKENQKPNTNKEKGKKGKATVGAKAEAEKKVKDDAEKPSNRGQGVTSAKERIEAQLRQAVEEGKMPNYCENCGAIETPTWRRVTLPVEGEDPEKTKNILLCNPCGLWHATKKSMRPPELWDSKKEACPTKKPRNRSRKKQPLTASDNLEVESRAPPGSSVPITEAIVIDDQDDVPEEPRGRRATTPSRLERSHRANVEWTAAIAADERMVQSSPIKKGTAGAPIELDKYPSPRRRLFPQAPPSAGLHESGENIRKTKEQPLAINELKPNEKENFPPEQEAALEDVDGSPSRKRKEIASPLTPKRRKLASPGQFKTPDRRPTHNGSTNSFLRSPWRFSPGISPGISKLLQLSPTRHRTPLINKTGQQNGANLSPGSEMLARLLSESGGGLPNGDDILDGTDLLTSGQDFRDFFGMGGMGLESDADIFSTDNMMPSSPPPLFNLYEDPDPSSGVWSEFLPSSPRGFGELADEVDMEMLGANTVLQGGKSTKAVNGAISITTGGNGGSNGGSVPGSAGLTVDFSTFFEESEGGAMMVRTGSGGESVREKD